MHCMQWVSERIMYREKASPNLSAAFAVVLRPRGVGAAFSFALQTTGMNVKEYDQSRSAYGVFLRGAMERYTGGSN